MAETLDTFEIVFIVVTLLGVIVLYFAGDKIMTWFMEKLHEKSVSNREEDENYDNIPNIR